MLPTPDLDPDDVAARAALARAAAGQLLCPADIRAIWHLSEPQWFRLNHAHAFDRFLVKKPISRDHRFSGALVYRHVQGEPEYEPTFGHKRAR